MPDVENPADSPDSAEGEAAQELPQAVREALVQWQEGRLQDAEALLRDELGRSAGAETVIVFLCWLLAMQGRVDEMLDLCDAQLRLAPPTAALLWLRASGMMWRGLDAEALAFLDNAEREVTSSGTRPPGTCP